MTQLYIGLMSGTSMDSIDCALVNFVDNHFELIETHSIAYPESVRQQLQALSTPGSDDLNRLGQLDRQVGYLFAQASIQLLDLTGHYPKEICAIGSHGQNVRHQPNLEHPFTLQIGDPNAIAELTGITTVADFRRRDIVNGGQGAPLTPAFHHFAFRSQTRDRVIVNIGGISNLTYLPANEPKVTLGFDCGPGNTLLDQWIYRCLEKAYDEQGNWAHQGEVLPSLLDKLLQDPFFQKKPPKSTGLEYFNLNWVTSYLGEANVKPQDLQATLAELTAAGIVNAINQVASRSAEVYLCGGGVHNTDLVARIKRRRGDTQIETTSELGLDPQWVEAAAFAWLAKQTLEGLPGNLPSVTGAKKACILGGVYLS